ncbi:hypothetical protein H0X09_01480 [Candidatus Saccharibacteria bacterium]|nr:hypothetical protein [Candidatus Saccharibacteria bacterium]
MKYQLNNGIELEKSKVKRFITTGLASVVLLAGVAMPVLASGNAQSGPTVGNCISDIVYGNEPNMANGAPGGPAEQVPGTKGGNVVPTQSPGPFVNNPTDPDNPTRGRSVGQFQQDGINIPELCTAAFSPAN